MNKKRQDISNDQKQEICRFARDHPTKKQVDIIDWFYDKYKIKLPKTTISGILKKKETYLNTDIVNKFRDRKAKFPELERALFLWFCDKRANFICISDQILVEQAHKFANEFYSQFEIEDFKFSEGWIQKFKKRNNISLHSVQGEAASVDMSNLEIEREKLKQLTGQYDPADIFNLDETALFYRLQPNKTLSNTKAIGTKQEKNRITVALCCNALGTEKLKPIVICKNKKPRCFKDFDPNVKTYFYHNTKAWMTSLIFSDFVEKWNNYLNFFFPNRKVLLLVDNAGGHNMTKTVFSHIKIHYLPPNMTSMIQPLDAGIIKSFKSHYKKYLLNFLIDSIEINNTVEPPSVKEAIDMTVKAWHKVSRQTIHNCWIHCDILQHNSLVTSELVPDLGLAPLLDKYSSLTDGESCGLEEFMNAEDSEPIGEQMTDKEIVEIVRGVEEEEECPRVIDELKQSRPKTSDALNSFKIVKNYFELSSDFSEQHSKTLTDLELYLEVLSSKNLVQPRLNF